MRNCRKKRIRIDGVCVNVFELVLSETFDKIEEYMVCETTLKIYIYIYITRKNLSLTHTVSGGNGCGTAVLALGP